MRFLFVMDPAEKMIPDKDTSFAFLRAARARGHDTLHCEPAHIHNLGKDVFAHCHSLSVSDTTPHVTLGARTDVALAELDAVFVRKDPPFDSPYIHLTQQLDLIKDRTLVVNDPQGLRDANEKLFTFHFAQHMPQTLVSSEMWRILEFLREVGGQAVLKPLDGAGGSGVVSISTEGSQHARAHRSAHSRREGPGARPRVPAGDQRW